MSKLTDIKFKIDQLDGGGFQNLCDAYLTCRGYGAGYSLGMNTGTDKTAKGNPDTYFLTTNSKYVFVMYTTQKTNFVSKVFEDIDKCFDSSKTGLAPEDIVEIVYCHTYGRLSPGDHQALSKYCESHRAVLTLIGLDELGSDLYRKYPRLAKDFLGISVDTGQISTPSEFVRNHDSNKLSAPLDTTFLFRDNEVKEAKEKLGRTDILVISGPAGVGKTRLSLQLCKQLSEEAGYEVLCIRSNGLELYEDLATTLEEGKDYLVFVDDANELTGLHYVLSYLLKEGSGTAYIKKLIISVRDYARYQVVQQVLDFEKKPEILKLGLLKDEDIRELMKTAYAITNSRYLDRIADIANGNARLAMLAGKVASDANTLDSIRDATELYENYYDKQIGIIAGSETGIVSAGIMAFFQKIHLENMERFVPIFELAKLTETQFCEDLRNLHDKELVDLCQDKAARISDQSFSNYLIKYVFVDKKVIPLSQMIEICFFINKERTIEACNILFNVFSEETSRRYIEEQINVAWSYLEKDIDKFLPFFRAFHMVRPTDTLIILNTWIDNEDSHEFDISLVDFKKNDNEISIEDDVVRILCSYADHEQLPEAVELLLLYYQKRPDLIEQIYTALTSRLGVNKDSHIHGYYTQQTVVEQLCNLIEINPVEQNLKLFVAVAEQYLRLSFQRTEGGRRNTVTIYTMPLMKSDVVLLYREKIITQLLSIYQNGKFQTEIENLLYNYCREGGNEMDYEIVSHELPNIFGFIELFSTDCVYHCVIAKHILKVSNRAGYDYCEPLRPFIESEKYTIYENLKDNLYEMRELTYKERTNAHKQRVQRLVQEYSLLDFRFLLDVCKESIQTVDKESQRLSVGLEYAIDSFSNNRVLYLGVIEAYMEANTPYNISPHKILCRLFAMMFPGEVKQFITKHDFAQKNSWLWAFYAELPEDQITVEWANDLLSFFASPPSNLGTSPLRPIDIIKKYEVVDQKILIHASEVICDHYEESPFVFHLYFRLMLNPYHREDCDILPCYKDNISLLEDIYLKCIAYSKNDDSDGKVLATIVGWDPAFLYRYIDEYVAEFKSSYSGRKEWAKRIKFLWDDDQYMERVTSVSDYLIEQSEGTCWYYSSMMEHLLQPSKDGSDRYKRQDLWIKDTIQLHSQNEQRMYGLFASIDECSSERRRTALKTLLEANCDFAVFKHLPLEPSHWGGMGSMIPCMQERIKYLSSLLPMLSGLKFLQHKKRVLTEIEIWGERIKREEIDELLESLG